MSSLPIYNAANVPSGTVTQGQLTTGLNTKVSKNQLTQAALASGVPQFDSSSNLTVNKITSTGLNMALGGNALTINSIKGAGNVVLNTSSVDQGEFVVANNAGNQAAFGSAQIGGRGAYIWNGTGDRINCLPGANGNINLNCGTGTIAVTGNITQSIAAASITSGSAGTITAGSGGFASTGALALSGTTAPQIAYNANNQLTIGSNTINSANTQSEVSINSTGATNQLLRVSRVGAGSIYLGRILTDAVVGTDSGTILFKTGISYSVADVLSGGNVQMTVSSTATSLAGSLNVVGALVQTSTPTWSAGTGLGQYTFSSGAGISGVSGISITGGNLCGVISFHTGSSPSSGGVIVTIYPSVSPPTNSVVTLTAANALTAPFMNQVFVNNAQNNFSIQLISGASLAASSITPYSFNYTISGY